MNLRNHFKKLGIAVAMSTVLTLAVPVVMPANATTMVSAASVKLSESKISLVVGKSKKLTVSGTTKTITWKSSDKSVATVNKNGKVTAKAYGTCKITATVGSKKLTCKVTVKQYKEEKLSFDCGATFVIPKGWTSTEYPIVGSESKMVYDENSQGSYLLLSVAPFGETVSSDDFLKEMKASMTKETLEQQIEASLAASAGQTIDVTTETFSNADAVEGNIAVLCTYAEYTYGGEALINMMVYTISDGTYVYQIAAYQPSTDTSSDIFEVAGYMAENLGVIAE